MAKWEGQADKAAETAGGGGGNFVPAPRGLYTIQVADTKTGLTKEKKLPKVDLECEISDEGEEFGKKVWLTITKIDKGEKGHGIMIHNLHAFGIELDGNYNFDTDDLQGKSARVLLGVTQREKVKDGRTYLNDVNFVEEVYTKNHPEPDPTMLPPAKKQNNSKPAAPAGNVPSNIAKTFPGARPAKQEEVPF